MHSSCALHRKRKRETQHSSRDVRSTDGCGNAEHVPGSHSLLASGGAVTGRSWGANGAVERQPIMATIQARRSVCTRMENRSEVLPLVFVVPPNPGVQRLAEEGARRATDVASPLQCVVRRRCSLSGRKGGIGLNRALFRTRTQCTRSGRTRRATQSRRCRPWPPRPAPGRSTPNRGCNVRDPSRLG
jgi:hypothetical protein